MACAGAVVVPPPPPRDGRPGFARAPAPPRAPSTIPSEGRSSRAVSAEPSAASVAPPHAPRTVPPLAAAAAASADDDDAREGESVRSAHSASTCTATNTAITAAAPLLPARRVRPASALPGSSSSIGSHRPTATPLRPSSARPASALRHGPPAHQPTAVPSPVFRGDTTADHRSPPPSPPPPSPPHQEGSTALGGGWEDDEGGSAEEEELVYQEGLSPGSAVVISRSPSPERERSAISLPLGREFDPQLVLRDPQSAIRAGVEAAVRSPSPSLAGSLSHSHLPTSTSQHSVLGLRAETSHGSGQSTATTPEPPWSLHAAAHPPITAQASELSTESSAPHLAYTDMQRRAPSPPRLSQDYSGNSVVPELPLHVPARGKLGLGWGTCGGLPLAARTPLVQRMQAALMDVMAEEEADIAGLLGGGDDSMQVRVLS
jgi:hypothetical protein